MISRDSDEMGDDLASLEEGGSGGIGEISVGSTGGAADNEVGGLSARGGGDSAAEDETTSRAGGAADWNPSQHSGSGGSGGELY